MTIKKKMGGSMKMKMVSVRIYAYKEEIQACDKFLFTSYPSPFHKLSKSSYPTNTDCEGTFVDTMY